MFGIYINLIKDFKNRVFLFKMEHFITNLEKSVKGMCVFLSLDYTEEMLNFPSRMRNVHKRKCYKPLDKGQLQLWRSWETIYDGFFLTQSYDINAMFKSLIPYIDYFNYDAT